MSDLVKYIPDLLLVILLLSLSWSAVSTHDMKRGVVFFIAFGLLLAVTWARLHAPDLALAEAAIGAGLAGAMLLAALRDEPNLEKPIADFNGVRLWLLNLLTLAVAIIAGWALFEALKGGHSVQLANAVQMNLEKSGVSNPVTAVLLNFRAYDTLLELAVVLVAVLGVLVLGQERPRYRQAGPVFCGLIQWLVPLLIVTSGYLLWVGAHAPGGAFQAGATLAAAAVMLRLGGYDRAGVRELVQSRWLLVAGVGVFLLIGLIPVGSGFYFLQYPLAWSGQLILVIETAATFSIATALALAYQGGQSQTLSEQSSIDDEGEHRCL